MTKYSVCWNHDLPWWYLHIPTRWEIFILRCVHSINPFTHKSYIKLMAPEGGCINNTAGCKNQSHLGLATVELP